MIFGGDLNEPDRNMGGTTRPWHALLNGDAGGELGYRDAIYHRCQQAANLATCLVNNRTGGQDRRIDFLFAQEGDGED